MALLNWVFYIPEIVFLAIMFLSCKWTFKSFSKFRNDKQEGVKVVAISQLKDKQVFNIRERKNRWRRKNYKVSTGYGSFAVDQATYENLKDGDTVYSFHGKYSNWLIGVYTSP